MKKFIFAAFIFAGFTLSQSADAQISIRINIGNQPAWGPVGYDYARYYYLPEANVYYDIDAARYMYLQRGRWVTARQLPSMYRGINLYNTYKVVINRNYAPYRDNRQDIMTYGRYRNVHNQYVIRDSRDVKYYQSRYHPRHKEWRSSDRRDDNRYGDRRDNDRGRRR
ncbi:MAG TPA: hypothetical protein PKE30_07485 [Niabella sp.]|nr:hypothetical protein [Niabella sp.]